jgi:hypothetical protein
MLVGVYTYTVNQAHCSRPIVRGGGRVAFLQL